METIIQNAVILDDTFCFRKLDVRLHDGIIVQISDRIPLAPGENVIDGSGQYLLPGFVDIHTHGCAGYSYMTADRTAYRHMCRFLAENGVTSVAPACITAPEEEIRAMCAFVRNYCMEQDASSPMGARVAGIYMEGPFLSPKRLGAHREEYLLPPDVNLYRRLQDASGGCIRVVCIAPELPGSDTLIRTAVRDGVTVSAAHTDANYDMLMQGVRVGVSHATHLYNAMSPMTHRAPGAVGAVLDSGLTAELICDGFHLHPATIRLAFRLLGSERTVLVSDSMEACGMPDGNYTLGGIPVTVREGHALTQSGTIAGSCATVSDCVRQAIRFGVPAQDAICAATLTPARIIHASGRIGSIHCGKDADLVLTDRSFVPLRTLIRGVEVFRRGA